MADLSRKLLLGTDARSGPGVFSRGKPVYKGVSNAPNRGKKTKNVKYAAAIARRLKNAGRTP